MIEMIESELEERAKSYDERHPEKTNPYWVELKERERLVIDTALNNAHVVLARSSLPLDDYNEISGMMLEVKKTIAAKFAATTQSKGEVK